MSDKKIKVLIIEDDPFLSSMYATKFELEGFAVFSGDNGQKGLDLALVEIPDIILLDILMPVMNGFEVLENLKKNDKTKNIPTILLTNLNQKDEIERGFALGADDYLIKAHFMPSEVVEKVRGLISDKN
jgi:DNA-binding response OmpR family regulator